MRTMPLTRQEERRLYERLLAKDTDATLDLITAFLERLIGSLRSKFRDLPDATVVDDMVIDALLRFPKQPHKYNPTLGSLYSYLYQDAYRDIIDAYRRDKARAGKLQLISLETVGNDVLDTKESVEEMVLRQRLLTYIPYNADAALVLAEVRTILNDANSRAFVHLHLSGERRTEEYARILGIQHLPLEEQRRHVKREKDKWNKRWKRLGAKLDDI